MLSYISRIPVWKAWLIALVVMALVISAGLGAGVPWLHAQSSGGMCLRDATGFTQPNICNASDVQIGAFELVEGPDSCTPGELIEIEVSATLLSGAQERYDIGLYVAEDGGNAVDAGTTCFRDYLHPVSADNSDLNLSGGSGPFYNGEIGLSDTCGDIQQRSESIYLLNEGRTITIVCQDSDGDGIADVGTALTWDNSAGSNCTNELGTVPDQTSKCLYGSINISGLVVPETAYIEVVKQLLPEGDGGLFDLQIDGQDKATDAGDGDTTGPVEVSAGTSRDPGDTHSVGESAGTGTELATYNTSIECVYRNTTDVVASGAGPGPLLVPVQPDDDIVCTITNERKKGIILFEKEVIGGAAEPSEWTFTVDGQTVGHGGGLELYTGSYTVSEDGGAENNANYTLTGASGVCTLENGEVVLTVTESGGTCTITNTRKEGSLDVVKVADDSSTWTLSYSGPASDSADLGDGGHLGPDTVPTGTYDVSEAPTEGIDPSLYTSSGTCVGASDNGTPSADGRTITGVVIGEGEAVECTFINVLRRGGITILKQVDPPSADRDFAFTSDSVPASFSLGHGDSQQFPDLDPGITYTFAETVPSEWELKQIACTGQDSSEVTHGDTGVSILLAPEEAIICTFTDDPLPAIAVLKSADPQRVPFPGDPVTYTVEVTNNSPGDEPVTLTSLQDDIYGDLTDPANPLLISTTCELVTIEPGASYQCSFVAGVIGEHGRSTTDTVTATGEDDEGNPAQDDDTATVIIEEYVPPEIGVVKTVDPELVLEPGGAVVYTVEVTNNTADSHVLTLTSLQDDVYGDLTDEANDAISDSTCELASIAPGDTYQCTFQAEVEGVAGDEVTDTVTATAMDPGGNEVSSDDDATVIIGAEPPETGVALPTPMVVGGLAALGSAFLAASAWARRRTQQPG